MAARFMQRRKHRPSDYPDTTAIKHLKWFREICKEDDLGIECAMATTLIALIRFDSAYRERPVSDWLGYYGMLRRELQGLKKALSQEFGAEQATADHAEVDK